MVKIESYQLETIKGFYERLVSKKANGIRFDYEVRVDNEQIVARTNDLKDFLSFQSFLLPQTQQIVIFIYKGGSNRYDKFIFEMEKIPSLEATIQSRLDEELKKLQLEWKFKQLNQELIDAKEKIKDLKETNKEQKHRIKALETDSKNSTMIQDLIGSLKQSSFFGNSVSEKNVAEFPLNGIPQKELMDALGKIQKNMGEETFQTFLGTSLMLGNHPNLIPEVKNLIEQYLAKQN